MFKNILQNKSSLSASPKSSQFILRQSDKYLRILQNQLDLKIDKRLVRTFFDLFITITMFRNRAMGLVLSELGGYICGFEHAPAGTKRISNLLRSKKWESGIIDEFFFARAKQRIKDLQDKGVQALMLWDDSRVEKSESRVSEGLCSVWSSKAKRLTRIRPGFFTPPKGRICVAGFQWTGVFLSHLNGIPSLCQMSWWTTRGKFKQDPDNIIWCLLKNYSNISINLYYMYWIEAMPIKRCFAIYFTLIKTLLFGGNKIIYSVMRKKALRKHIC